MPPEAPPAALTPALAALVARAASLDERLAAAGPSPTDPAAAAWARRWAEVVGRGDAAAFARRLAWDGLAPEALGGLVALPAGTPRWAALLAEWAEAPTDPAHLDFAADDPVPFAAVVAPAATVLARHLAARAPAGWARLAPGARADLGRALVRRLAAIGRPALVAAFDGVRAAAGHPADPAEAPDGAALHDAFVAHCAGAALLEALAPVPVLGRLWGTALAQAIDAGAEALDHLAADGPALAAAFGPGAGGLVTAIDAARSDPHGHGRTVWRLATEDGYAFYHKPRSVACEVAYGGLVAWLAAEGMAPELRAPVALDRGGHGWVAEVAAAELPDAAAADRFFARMGALVALAHALGANDLHAENLIAAGEHPVLVDLETLVPPRLVDEGAGAGFADAQAVGRLVDGGVLDSLLVSWPVPAADGYLDLAPLGDPLPAMRARRWVDVGTDRQREAEGPVPPAAEPHLPRLGGARLRARDHRDALLAGFDAAYALLLARREALLAPEGPLAAFADLPTRLLFRQTRHYGTLLAAGQAPERLADGRARSFGLDQLARTYIRQPVRPALWPLIGAERAALERLDVPYVAARTGSRDLVAEGVVLVDALPRAPIEDARLRLAALSPADHALQRQVLALALGSTRAEVPDEDLPLPGPPPAEAPGFDPLAAAARLGDRLVASAIRTADGAATWVAALPHDEAPRGRAVGVLGIDLWAGSLGPALFLAALARATGEPAYGALAGAAARPAILAGRDEAAELVTAFGVAGAAGVAYGLARLGALDAAEGASAHAAAGRIVRALGAPAFDAEPHPDVLGGLAGALAALLGVFAATGDQAALDGAEAAGAALLRQAEPASDGALRAWRGAIGTFPAGYGHGQAGIAAQLARLAAIGGEGLPAIAREALAFEATRFVPGAGDWRLVVADAPADAPPGFMAGWCHGAPGMALGRLAVRDLDPAYGADLGHALAAMGAAGVHAYDFPCCGSAGRIEAWLEAAAALGRPDLAARAHALAAAMPGVKATPPTSLEDADPRFLKGVAGVGWSLLRVADPALPCLLAGA